MYTDIRTDDILDAPNVLPTTCAVKEAVSGVKSKKVKNTYTQKERGRELANVQSIDYFFTVSNFFLSFCHFKVKSSALFSLDLDATVSSNCLAFLRFPHYSLPLFFSSASMINDRHRLLSLLFSSPLSVDLRKGHIFCHLFTLAYLFLCVCSSIFSESEISCRRKA